MGSSDAKSSQHSVVKSSDPIEVSTVMSSLTKNHVFLPLCTKSYKASCNKPGAANHGKTRNRKSVRMLLRGVRQGRRPRLPMESKIDAPKRLLETTDKIQRLLVVVLTVVEEAANGSGRGGHLFKIACRGASLVGEEVFLGRELLILF